MDFLCWDLGLENDNFIGKGLDLYYKYCYNHLVIGTIIFAYAFFEVT